MCNRCPYPLFNSAQRVSSSLSHPRYGYSAPMQAIQHKSSAAPEIALPMAINSSAPRSRLDDLPPELRNLIVNFTALEMRAVLAGVPHFRIRSDDVLRGRKRLCEWAAEQGYLDLLNWARPRDFPLLQLRDGKDACKAAAKGGQLAVLQWLREIRCRWDAWTSAAAAEGGHLEVLQWAHQRGCPLNESATVAAARGGHLRVLQWLRSNGCAWSNHVTYEAVRHGHREVLEWAIASKCPIDEAGAAAICYSGDVRMVEWALTRKLDNGWPRYLLDAPGLTLEVLRFLKERRPDLTGKVKWNATLQLARVGDLAGLQWARENGYFDPDAVGQGAARGGQLAVLQWARENGFSDQGWECSTLAAYGHLECLKWAVAIRKRSTSNACAYAAAGCHLSILQWLREEVHCEWDGDTLGNALEADHYEVFEWARQHGCPVNGQLFEAAVRWGNAEVLRWVFETDPDVVYDYEVDWCAEADNPQVLEVLRERGFTWGVVTSTEYARRGDLEMLQWAVRNGCPWNSATCHAARQEDNLYLLQWAIENDCPVDEYTRKWWSEYDLEKEFQ